MDISLAAIRRCRLFTIFLRSLVLPLLLLLVFSVSATAATESWNSIRPRQTLAALSKSSFPVTVDVIPGKLKVRVYLHDIPYPAGKWLSCWSYVSDGLASQKQKEIIFTLLRAPRQRPEDYPHDILDLLEGIYKFAQDGRLVDVGDVTLFGDSGFMRRDIRGIGYVAPESLPGIDIPSTAIAGILLKGDEALIAWNLSLTRVTAQLGNSYRYYPYPFWSDFQRAPVSSSKDMDTSLLEKLPRAHARASYYEENNHIFLLLDPSARERLHKQLQNVAVQQPLALRTQVDPRADSCLVWSAGQTKPMAIIPPGSKDLRKTGAFLMFVPEQKEAEIRMIEDGYAILLTTTDWQRIREAIDSGADVSIPPAKPGAAALTLEWARNTYTSPVTGETFSTEHWIPFHPDSVPQSSAGVVTVKAVVLLSDQREAEDHTTAEDLANYLKGIEAAVESFFAPSDRKGQRDVSIRFNLEPNGGTIQIAVRPELDPNLLAALHQQLIAVPQAKVSGSVNFDLILSVWDEPVKP